MTIGKMKLRVVALLIILAPLWAAATPINATTKTASFVIGLVLPVESNV